jgi:hypothetical protein
LGRVLITGGALEEFKKANQHPGEFLIRHAKGDWGDLDEDDRKENELSLQEGFRIFSSYRLRTGVKIWVITEADRSATTLLLPEDY